jgi:hypothetical protein
VDSGGGCHEGENRCSGTHLGLSGVVTTVGLLRKLDRQCPTSIFSEREFRRER